MLEARWFLSGKGGRVSDGQRTSRHETSPRAFFAACRLALCRPTVSVLAAKLVQNVAAPPSTIRALPSDGRATSELGLLLLIG